MAAKVVIKERIFKDTGNNLGEFRPQDISIFDKVYKESSTYKVEVGESPQKYVPPPIDDNPIDVNHLKINKKKPPVNPPPVNPPPVNPPPLNPPPVNPPPVNPPPVNPPPVNPPPVNPPPVNPPPVNPPPENTPPENTPPENTPPENTPPENTPPVNPPPVNPPPVNPPPVNPPPVNNSNSEHGAGHGNKGESDREFDPSVGELTKAIQDILNNKSDAARKSEKVVSEDTNKDIKQKKSSQ